jgi:cobaltochelatase CobN
LFAFAATTNAVKDHHFDAVFQAYILEEETRNFIGNANPDALSEIASRLHEALKRGLWKPKSNHAHELLQNLSVAKPRSTDH